MKTIILGAFIIGLFFAVAQSISISQKYYKYPGKGTGFQTPASSPDTVAAYATTRFENTKGLKPPVILSQAR